MDEKIKDKIVSEHMNTAEGRKILAQSMVQPIRGFRKGEVCGTCGYFIHYSENECCSMERILRK
jgi:hypothetical protein